MTELSYFLANEKASQQLGSALSEALKQVLRRTRHQAIHGSTQGLPQGLHLYLQGDLGAGKTTLVRAMLEHFGYHGTVRSPTYSLVEQYLLEVDTNSRIDFYHFDFYRLNSQESWAESGFREYFEADALCVVEWPECAGPDLPGADIQVQIFYETQTDQTSIYLAPDAIAEVQHAPELPVLGRRVHLLANTAIGRACLEQFQKIYLPDAAF